ncbi:hypothetical protein EV178_004853 [Coemansia sp. RSA 1646]|nr:hypothetical protein EV178_004853 [Coemansia sp. RSA 1646]KAJ2212346.1 hypothetical protein EV179_004741 [Coemansia sp. RSA 487]
MGLHDCTSSNTSPSSSDSQRSAERMQSLGICDSSQTLDESAGIDRMLLEANSNDGQHAAWRDLCGWIRRPKNSITPAISAVSSNDTGRKPNVIYRRNKSQVSEKPSNLSQQKTGDTFKTMRSDATIQPKPSCPTEIAKLLHEFSSDCGPISSFMNEHESSMEPLMQYVLEDAHFMPPSPGVVPINDPTAQYLPPLAAEEYAAHISRITYFVRTLQALEAADPGCLSNPYARLLIDLLFGLERAITLPRVDFLRRHAETVHAMSIARNKSYEQKNDTILAIGNADEWVDLDTDMDAQRILNVARSIPRHPDLRSSTANTSQRNRRRAIVGSLPGQSTCDGSILGNRLQPDSGLCSDMFMESSNDPLIAHTDAATKQTGNADVLTEPMPRRIIASTPEFSAAQYHPKLHPVVEPHPMDVSNPQHIVSLVNPKEGRRPNRLYRRAVRSNIEQPVT